MQNCRHLRFALKAACWIVLALTVSCCNAQTAHELSQVKKVCVSSWTRGNGTAELRQSLVKQLQKSGKFEIVATPSHADAVIEGSGDIWVKGHIATNPRSPSTNRQAVYGGFLSVEIVGAENAVLWSYLSTPSKFTWGSISDDLAANVVREMLAAYEKRDLSPGPGVVETSLHGAGSTFAAPLYRRWFESFRQQHPDVLINYDAVGSGLGTQLLMEGKVDFAASDVPTSDPASSQPVGGFQRVASVLGGVVPIYNLKGPTQDLKFTPEILAGIYLGKITKWNDPMIKGSNKGVALPNSDIVVVHRSDGSGTTYAWSDYLAKVSVEWRNSIGAGIELNWPVGMGVEHSEGVAATVQRIPNSIGYVELVYAIQHQLSFGTVRNAAGEYIRADLESVAAAAGSAATGNAASLSSITNAPGKNAYPIATFTFLLLPQQVKDPARKAALVRLLQWILTSGQKECSALGYAPLPREIAIRQFQALNSLK